MHIIIIFIVILYCTTLAKRRLLQRVKKKKLVVRVCAWVRACVRICLGVSICNVQLFFRISVDWSESAKE